MTRMSHLDELDEYEAELELRLKKARSLLLQTEMSVINVALACGFSSPSHFSKCYRAFYGRTPYRERGIPTLETGAAA